MWFSIMLIFVSNQLQGSSVKEDNVCFDVSARSLNSAAPTL